jgi:phospholipid transport system substrate-binding protein
MNIVKKLLLTTSLALGLVMVNAASAADEAPEALIKRVSQEVLDAAKEDKDIQAGNEQKILSLVETKILPYIDFKMMTKMAAANNWDKATPEQQQELVKQFQRLLVYTYSGALSQVKDQKLRYRPALINGDNEVVVRSEVVSSRSEPIQLNYRLTKESDGWKIYDINVLGAWLIETYKGSFRSEINKSDIDGLIKVLVAKNAKLATTFAKKTSQSK